MVVLAETPRLSRASMRCLPGTSGHSSGSPAVVDPTGLPSTVHSILPPLALTAFNVSA